MFRKLTLIRHAKSSWETPSPDFDRSLSNRGLSNLKRMSKVVEKNVFDVEKVYSSDARRAADTASYFFANSLASVEYDQQYYTFNWKDLLRKIRSWNDEFKNVAIVGHNPALTELVNSLQESYIENIPTCGVVVLRGQFDQWEHILESKLKLVYYSCPKNYD